MNLAASISQAVQSIPMPGTAYREITPGRILHVDGDYAAYYHSGKDDTHWTKGRDEFLDRIRNARIATGSEFVIVHLSAPGCSKGDRFEVSFTKPYQGQRHSDKPANWQAMRDFMAAPNPAFKLRVWEDREADDGIALHCTARAERGGLDAIHTRDKDFRMFPGIHLDWTTFSTLEVPLNAFELHGNNGKMFGHKWFWTQMLWGDGADNIPGLKGVGEKKAHDALRGVRDNADAERVVVELYRAKLGPLWAATYVEQAALLWMRNDADASLLNFLQVMTPSAEVMDAAAAMADRVQKIKDEVASYGNQD